MGVLDGRVALVTGASSGIGEAAAVALAEAGAKVAVNGRRAERLAISGTRSVPWQLNVATALAHLAQLDEALALYTAVRRRSLPEGVATRCDAARQKRHRCATRSPPSSRSTLLRQMPRSRTEQ